MALTIGKKLQKLRKQKGLSQQELADHLNVARQTIGKWEQDLSLPDLEALVEMSEFFGISIDELVEIENKVEKDVPITYSQIQTIVDNLQKQNKSRYLLQLIVIMLCIASLLFTASMKIQLDAQNKQNTPTSQSTITSQKMLEDYFDDAHFIEKLTDICITYGGIEERTRFDIANYDLDHWEMTLDYHIFLKEYSSTTQLSIKFDTIMSLANEEFILDFQKISENEFVLNQTIPLEDYSNISLIIKNADDTTIEKLGSMDYLTHIVKSQIWLYMPFDQTLQLNQITYNPNFRYAPDAMKIKGTLDGILTLRFLDENNQLLCDRISIDMSKMSTTTLSDPLPTQEKIHIQVDYDLTPKYISSIYKKTYSGSFTGTETSTHFEITSTKEAYNICHYIQSTNKSLKVQYY